MTYYDVLQDRPTQYTVWDGLGGNSFVFRGESGWITAVKTGADRSAPEVVGHYT